MTGSSVQIGLLSHTNAGKTTLARTLLRSDIGEVSDRAHVTEFAESHVLLETDQHETLILWDTPGFGDSVRLLRRLKASGNPLGWLISQVWDRFAERPLFCSQQAMRNARDASDVLLYVVNAAEDPASASYVDAELQILSWIDKPIVLLLNQLGPPRAEQSTASDVELWRKHVAAYPSVKAVVPFDAFARCWIQESALLTHIEQALPAPRRAPFSGLREAWRRRNLEVFGRSMEVLARQLARSAVDRELLAERKLAQKARAWLGSVASGADAGDVQLQQAQRALSKRLDAQVREATEELVRLHGLSGRATDEVLKTFGREFAVQRAPDADKASLLGGVLSGAVGGLAADIATGGLTFGAGALLGGVLGALGARELTQAYNLARGAESGDVRWSAEFLDARVQAALLRYLAVAHFGRGRGDFVTSRVPEHWQRLVGEEFERQREALKRVWSELPTGLDAGALEARLVPLLGSMTQSILVRLYPEAPAVFGHARRSASPMPRPASSA